MAGGGAPWDNKALTWCYHPWKRWPTDERLTSQTGETGNRWKHLDHGPCLVRRPRRRKYTGTTCMGCLSCSRPWPVSLTAQGSTGPQAASRASSNKPRLHRWPWLGPCMRGGPAVRTNARLPCELGGFRRSKPHRGSAISLLSPFVPEPDHLTQDNAERPGPVDVKTRWPLRAIASGDFQ